MEQILLCDPCKLRNSLIAVQVTKVTNHVASELISIVYCLVLSPYFFGVPLECPILIEQGLFNLFYTPCWTSNGLSIIAKL